MRGRYPSTRPPPAIAGSELVIVGAAELVGVLAIAPGLPAGLDDWWAPRWNVAPGQPVRAVSARDGAPRLTLARWGLTMPSHGAKRPQFAAFEGVTAAVKPLLRNALSKRRCLVLADGFYAWRRDGKAGAPVRFAPRDEGDGRAVTLAAIARGRQHEGAWLEELALLTTAADGLVAPVDDRRPVVIGASDRERWMDTEFPADAVLDLLAPRSLSDWVAVDAPIWLNSARVEQAAAEPAQPAQSSLFDF